MNAPINQGPQYDQQVQGQQQYVSFQDVMAAKQITFQDIKEHMTGPVVSLIFHAIAIAFFGSIIIFDPPQERKEIEVEMTEVEIKEWEKPPEPPQTEEVQTEQEVEIERPDAVADVAVEIDDAPAVDAPADVVVPNVLAIAPSNSALILPGVMSLRSGSGRKAALKKYGGSSKTENSVNKGLRWLRDHQNADGSWGEGKNTKAFLTSVALLAFLGHNETPSSQEYGACVLKAIRWLIDLVNNRGNNGLVKEDRNTYGHAAVAYALSEAFAMTRIPMIETAMNSMVETLIRGQNAQGGYNYGHNNGAGRFDLSVSGWHYQALKAAFAAGSTVQGLEGAIEKAIKGMKEVMYTKDGGFTYSRELGKEGGGGGATTTMTSVGALCLQLLGEGKSREVDTAIKWLQERDGGIYMKCDWKGVDNYKCGKAKTWSLYWWYYQTQAIFQHTDGTGALWNSWNKEFQNALLKEQFADGHWTSPVEKYSKQDKDAHGETVHTFDKMPLDLDIYSTALCCLMLEVYYRYLPTFKVVSTPVLPTTSGDSAKGTDTSGLIIE